MESFWSDRIVGHRNSIHRKILQTRKRKSVLIRKLSEDLVVPALVEAILGGSWRNHEELWGYFLQWTIRGGLPPKVAFFRLEVKAFTRELKYTTRQEKHHVGIRGVAKGGPGVSVPPPPLWKLCFKQTMYNSGKNDMKIW